MLATFAPIKASSTTRIVYYVTLVAIYLGFATVTSSAQRASIEPEAGSGRQAKTLVVAHKHMVVAAHPLATAAGLDILRAGGTAIDAAIAVQLVLGLVEPQSSGLGGGAFLLHWDATTRAIRSYDGRETAPAAARPDRFPPGRPFHEHIQSGASIGVPGVVRLLEHVHRRHGRLPWAQLFAAAATRADTGFTVTPRLATLLRNADPASFSHDARSHFYGTDGQPLSSGQLLRNPAYAATLRTIASGGADAFYRGPIAEAIVAAARSAPAPSGDLTAADLAAYQVREREPVCVPYRRHRVCSMAPPSSGGIAIGQILGLLEPWNLGSGPTAAMNPRALHLIVEAEKLAYADRDHYIADPDSVAIPHGLLARSYLSQRRALIKGTQPMPRPSAGEPPGLDRRTHGPDSTAEVPGTSHISIVDADGNAVAMTTTIEAAFGSRVWAAGFLLNNQLTDFAIRPSDGKGGLAANAVGPGKRPRSSMAPTLVFDESGALAAALGSPGGSRIILYVAKTLVSLLDWKLDAQAAAALPNFGSRGTYVEMEPQMPGFLAAARLRAYGHRIRYDDMTSGLHIITKRGNLLLGGADPRREGVAMGD